MSGPPEEALAAEHQAVFFVDGWLEVVEVFDPVLFVFLVTGFKGMAVKGPESKRFYADFAAFRFVGSVVSISYLDP